MKNLLLVLAAAVLLLAAQIVTAQDINGPRTISAEIINGKAISLPAPKYPKEARENGISGTVYVEVIINKDGLVESAKVTSGHPQLREASIAAARSSKFKQTFLRDKPVRIRGTIFYNFGKKPSKPKTTYHREHDPKLLNGSAISLPTPIYPASANPIGLKGMVVISIVVDDDGNVSKAEAISGHPLLRKSAVAAAKKAKFKPDGDPAQQVSGVLIYNFAFKNRVPK